MELGETVQKTFLQMVGTFCFNTIDFKQHVKLSSKLTFLVDGCTEHVYILDHTFYRSESHMYKSQVPERKSQTDAEMVELDETAGYDDCLVIKEEPESSICNNNEESSDAEEVISDLPSPQSSDTGNKPHNQLKEKAVISSCPAKVGDEVTVHLRDCNNMDSTYLCNACNKTFQSKVTWTQHMEDRHGDEDVSSVSKRGRGRKCAQRKTFKYTDVAKVKKIKSEKMNKTKMKVNNKEDHDTKYICDLCGKQFKSRRTMYYHKRSHKEKSKIYTCTEPGCNATFNHSNSFKVHHLKHAGSRPFKCHVCDKKYFTAYNLRLHVQGVHSEKKNYTCKICGKHFSYPTSLRAHELSHEEGLRVKCEECDKSFVHSQALQYHIRSIHSEPGIHKCDECNKEFKSDVILKRHKRRHTDDAKRFMCDICARQFMYKSDLESHKVIHKDEKKFVCKVCGKAFKAYPTLYYHTFVHKEETPFQCAQCGKAFKNRERCKAHERRHSDIKPFECETCQRGFLNKVELNKHKTSVHAAIKKFVCNLCGKAMARADNLRAHMKLHLKPDYKPRQSRKTKNNEENLQNCSTITADPEDCAYMIKTGNIDVENNAYMDATGDSIKLSIGNHGDKSHFSSCDIYQPGLSHFLTTDTSHLPSRTGEQNTPLNLHHPSGDLASFQLLTNVNTLPQTPSVPSVGPPSNESISGLQQPNFMYTRPYMYPPEIQSQPGATNGFYQ